MCPPSPAMHAPAMHTPLSRMSPCHTHTPHYACPPAIHAPLQHILPTMHALCHARPPPLLWIEWLTNITFPQLRLRAVIIKPYFTHRQYIYKCLPVGWHGPGVSDILSSPAVSLEYWAANLNSKMRPKYPGSRLAMAVCHSLSCPSYRISSTLLPRVWRVSIATGQIVLTFIVVTYNFE